MRDDDDNDNFYYHRVQQLQGTADALVSRGILALLAHLLRGRPVQQILALEADEMARRLGLRTALSPGRNDGLASMVTTVQAQIRQVLTVVDSENRIKNENAAGQDDEKKNAVSEDTAADKAPTVALLLSGGVDSSVALHLLQRDGYNVTAFYLKIWLEDELAHLGQCVSFL